MKHSVLRSLTGLMLALLVAMSAAAGIAQPNPVMIQAADYPVKQDGSYTSKEEVAVYLHTYGGLPGNFLTKREADRLGWDNRAGNLHEVAPGCSIGGDYFGNYEKNLDLPSGERWTECDIAYQSGHRNGERIVFSQSGLIYYSGDHYNHFTQLVVVEGENNKTKGFATDVKVKKSGEYTSAEEVAAYLTKYGKLPANYLTKSEAKDKGWSNQKDNLGKVAPGCAVGGDTFGNREGLLPKKKGRTWQECDVNTVNGKRGKQRLVYSNDGLIFYSDDNHKSFIQVQ